eukprot:2623851-Prymnesium_polylepis.1
MSTGQQLSAVMVVISSLMLGAHASRAFALCRSQQLPIGLFPSCVPSVISRSCLRTTRKRPRRSERDWVSEQQTRGCARSA